MQVKEALFGFNFNNVKNYLGRPVVQNRMMQGAVMAATPLVLGGIANGVIGAVQGGMSKMKLESSFQKMQQLYPELQRESPEKVRLYFDTIASGSPDIASQPLVVGGLLRRMLNYDGFDHSTYMDLGKHQKNMSGLNAGRGVDLGFLGRDPMSDAHRGSITYNLGQAALAGFRP